MDKFKGFPLRLNPKFFMAMDSNHRSLKLFGAPSRIRTYVTKVQAWYTGPLYDQCSKSLAYLPGLEPGTIRLTAGRSAVELETLKLGRP